MNESVAKAKSIVSKNELIEMRIYRERMVKNILRIQQKRCKDLQSLLL